jgi:hypothetical protein
MADTSVSQTNPILTVGSSTLLDQDRIRWPGSGSNPVPLLPYGFYKNDARFVQDCQSSAVWAAYRLGYPVQDVEMLDLMFYAAYEEATNAYEAQVNQFNIRNYIGNFQGQDVQSLGNLSGQAVVGSSLAQVIHLADNYGAEAGVGGLIDWKKGFIVTEPFVQTYDLQALWGDPSESCERIEIKRIFHERQPAFARIYDPFSMTGMSYSNIFNELGFGAYSPAVQFLMTPLFEDLLRGQAIEFNDMIRKSQYSFEIINNKLRLFPIPQESFRLYFDYIVESDRAGATIISGSAANPVVSDYSNIPYQNLVYSNVNEVGKQWIRKYFLACCKETLGIVRQKYSTIPIPGGEVTLDGSELRQEAQQEKEGLITELRENLEAAGRKQQIEDRAKEAEFINDTLRRVPLLIYVG